MKFEWDEAKRHTNLKKHGIDFLDAIQIFNNYTLTIIDDRFDYDEERFITFGFLDVNVIVVVHTFVEGDTIRIISARKATKYEQKRFIASFTN